MLSFTENFTFHRTRRRYHAKLHRNQKKSSFKSRVYRYQKDVIVSGMCSTIRRAVLSHICCFGERKVVLFQILWTVLSHVMRGRPSCLLQSTAGEANRILLAAALSSMHAVCPNTVSQHDWVIADTGQKINGTCGNQKIFTGKLNIIPKNANQHCTEHNCYFTALCHKKYRQRKNCQNCASKNGQAKQATGTVKLLAVDENVCQKLTLSHKDCNSS